MEEEENWEVKGISFSVWVVTGGDGSFLFWVWRQWVPVALGDDAVRWLWISVLGVKVTGSSRFGFVGGFRFAGLLKASVMARGHRGCWWLSVGGSDGSQTSIKNFHLTTMKKENPPL